MVTSPSPVPATTLAADFLVSRGNIRAHMVRAAIPIDAVALEVGQILLTIDAFAFTANNVTYGVFGDGMSYWNFFPLRDASDGVDAATWGRVPVWGFGTVARSNNPGIATRSRFYGYYPMSSYLVVTPGTVAPSGFRDRAAHRATLPAIYNAYIDTAQDPLYDPAREAEHMLYMPLFETSLLIDDFLAGEAFFGARAILVSSASSKTAFGMAHQLSRRQQRAFEIVGLTSAKNQDFVRRLGCYDRVVSYEDIPGLPHTQPAVYVDFAGSARLRKSVHHLFGDQLKHSAVIGAARWEEGRRGAETLPGAKPTFFFAPAQGAKRVAELGSAGYAAMKKRAWDAFIDTATKPGHTWLTIVRQSGPDVVGRVYDDTVEGRVPPDQGHILSMA